MSKWLCRPTGKFRKRIIGREKKRRRIMRQAEDMMLVNAGVITIDELRRRRRLPKVVDREELLRRRRRLPKVVDREELLRRWFMRFMGMRAE